MALEEENAKLRQENRELKAVIETLQSRVEEVEATLASLQPQKKTPPAFVKANKPKRQEKKRRKKRAAKHNRGHHRETPTRIETQRLEAWLTCGHELTKYQEVYNRQIIDIPEPQPVEIVKHRVEKDGASNVGVGTSQKKVAGNSRTGANGSSTKRVSGLYAQRLTVALPSNPGIFAVRPSCVNKRRGVGQFEPEGQKKLDKEINGLLQEARGSPHVHTDETGWREDGQNGYIWCLVTDTPRPVRYYDYHQSRAGKIVEVMLGNTFSGVLPVISTTLTTSTRDNINAVGCIYCVACPSYVKNMWLI